MSELCASLTKCVMIVIAGWVLTSINVAAVAQTKKTKYASMADWNLRAENLKPTGINPYFQPLIPGHRYVMEAPNFANEGLRGHYRRTTEVLHKTRTFDVPAIGGKFECAIVEEKEYVDDRQFTKSEHYYCFDRTTGSVYSAGETAWEGAVSQADMDFDSADRVTESWIVGQPDENGEIEMGLVFPGTWTLGARWIVDGAEGKAFVGGEAVESGLTMNTPAGTFENCVRTREYDLLDAADVTDKVWCYGVGLVSDTSGGVLAKTSHLDGKLPTPTPYHAYHKNRSDVPAKVEKEAKNVISKEKAASIGLSTVPGEVTDIAIENKMGGKRYVVEIRASVDDVETDVIIEMETGRVLATER